MCLPTSLSSEMCHSILQSSLPTVSLSRFLWAVYLYKPGFHLHNCDKANHNGNITHHLVLSTNSIYVVTGEIQGFLSEVVFPLATCWNMSVKWDSIQDSTLLYRFL